MSRHPTCQRRSSGSGPPNPQTYSQYSLFDCRLLFSSFASFRPRSATSGPSGESLPFLQYRTSMCPSTSFSNAYPFTRSGCLARRARAPSEMPSTNLHYGCSKVRRVAIRSSHSLPFSSSGLDLVRRCLAMHTRVYVLAASGRSPYKISPHLPLLSWSLVSHSPQSAE